METKLISLLKRYNLLYKEHISIASVETENLEKIKEIAPSIPLVRLYKNSEFLLKDAVGNDYELIGLECVVVSKK